ncbi:MKCA [Enterospora canceri]|uniref:MKCA n=1 Tax=Enterospora canceri TaxID=1081671 RepID=A0A1Y1S7R3_9MICR|nr:MKCA [Enterospora canceri]
MTKNSTDLRKYSFKGKYSSRAPSKIPKVKKETKELYTYQLPPTIRDYGNQLTPTDVIFNFESDEKLADKYERAIEFIFEQVLSADEDEKELSAMAKRSNVALTFLTYNIAIFEVNEIKILMKLIYDEDDYFEDEVTVLQHTFNSRVVYSYEFYKNTDDNKGVLSMEYLPVSGWFPKSTKKNGCLVNNNVDYKKKENLIRIWTRDVLIGLNSLHHGGYAHLDFKPDNVFGAVEEDRLVFKLIDFGDVAKVKRGEFISRDSGSTGYKHYKEMKENMAGTFSDIFALGMSLCYFGVKEDSDNLLHDFSKADVDESMAYVYKKYKYDTNYSDELIDFVECCLRDDLASRPSAEALLEHPFITGHTKMSH